MPNKIIEINGYKINPYTIEYVSELTLKKQNVTRDIKPSESWYYSFEINCSHYKISISESYASSKEEVITLYNKFIDDWNEALS